MRSVLRRPRSNNMRRVASSRSVTCPRRRPRSSGAAPGERVRRTGGRVKGDMRHKSHPLFCLARRARAVPHHPRHGLRFHGLDHLWWTTNSFIKEAADPAFVSWHQDSTYWGLHAQFERRTEASARAVERASSDPTAGKPERARCCDGWVALRGAAAGLDRWLAKAEFRPYMRVDLIVNITMHVFAKSEFESDKSTPWSLPC